MQYAALVLCYLICQWLWVGGVSAPGHTPTQSGTPKEVEFTLRLPPPHSHRSASEESVDLAEEREVVVELEQGAGAGSQHTSPTLRMVARLPYAHPEDEAKMWVSVVGGYPTAVPNVTQLVAECYGWLSAGDGTPSTPGHTPAGDWMPLLGIDQGRYWSAVNELGVGAWVNPLEVGEGYE